MIYKKKNIFYFYSIFLISFIRCYSIDKNFAKIMQPIISKSKDLVLARKKDTSLTMPIIAIAGSPAVGKTYFALSIVELLQLEGIKPMILRQDDFLEFSPIQGAIIHPYLNANKLRNFLKSIVSGQTELVKPFINRATIPYRLGEMKINYTNIDIILFEGVYTLCGPENFDFFKYCSFGIFLDANVNDICRWHWERELTRPARVQRTKSKFKHDLKGNMQDYYEHILPCKANASFVVYKKEKNSFKLYVMN